jgi:hypothetical protein
MVWLKNRKVLFCNSMRRKTKLFNGAQVVSAICMILALLWLTVSLPFVYASQQQQMELEKTAKNSISIPGTDEESNPLNGSTEEKAPSSSVSEEYLHDHHKSEYFQMIASQHHKCENADTYIAFHGELLVPPPNHS